MGNLYFKKRTTCYNIYIDNHSVCLIVQIPLFVYDSRVTSVGNGMIQRRFVAEQSATQKVDQGKTYHLAADDFVGTGEGRKWTHFRCLDLLSKRPNFLRVFNNFLCVHICMWYLSRAKE